MLDSPRRLTDRDILAARPARNPVDPRRPYAFLVEKERSASGRVDDVATVFLTNGECPFRCLMCDLWKNTTYRPVRAGDIPAQIDYALDRLPPANHIKLYNSGNFFDRRAIPTSDYGEIARRLRRFGTVIVENHPKLCGDPCLRFRDQVDGRLEIALGLETAHPGVLDRLNKGMTLDDFQRAAAFLRREGIGVRAFILLRPPYMTEEEGVEWAVRSIEFAFDAGVGCCSVIPTRPGNGIMEEIAASGLFEPPSMSSIEAVLDAGIRMQRGLVFMDLWDLERFSDCAACIGRRRERLLRMNLTQAVTEATDCECRDVG